MSNHVPMIAKGAGSIRRIAMPSVKKGEKRNDYVSRCVPEVMKEGRTQRQAVGKCEGMYSGRWKQKRVGKKW